MMKFTKLHFIQSVSGKRIMTRIDAWFCKCHSYNKMKTIDIEIPVGQIYHSTETCRRCGERKRVEVKAGYFR